MIVRPARAADLPEIVALLADDPLGATREGASDPPDPAYQSAFEAIAEDSNQLLAVLEGEDRVLGCLQLSFLPGLSRRGAWRGQIESVRVARDQRGRGLGRLAFAWAFERFRERGCFLVQLTSDKARPEALAFYRSLGFEASHEGLKLTLSGTP